MLDEVLHLFQSEHRKTGRYIFRDHYFVVTRLNPQTIRIDMKPNRPAVSVIPEKSEATHAPIL